MIIIWQNEGGKNSAYTNTIAKHCVCLQNILSMLIDTFGFITCLNLFWLTLSNSAKGYFYLKAAERLIQDSNPIEWPAATWAYLIFLILLHLGDCVGAALLPWSHITCSCITSFLFQSNVCPTFHYTWEKHSLELPRGMRSLCCYQASHAWKDIHYLEPKSLPGSDT